MNPSKVTFSIAPPPPPKSNEDRRHHNHQRVVVPHILLGITGSVAAVKGPELAVALARQLHAHIIVLMSRGGMSFWDRSAELYNPVVWKDYLSLLVSNSDGDGVQSFMSADNGRRNGDLRQDDAVDKQSNNDDGMSVGDDGTENSHNGKIMLVKADDEWKGWTKIGDPVLHIQLRDWADVLVIAPLSAHTLGKISNGLCDDTLTCVVRAWDFGTVDTCIAGQSLTTTTGTTPQQRQRRGPKPLVLAPAMNTAMWTHPLTQTQLNIIQGFWTGAKISNNKLSITAERGNTVIPKAMIVGGGIGHGIDEEVGRDEAKKYPHPIQIVDPMVKKLACGEIGSGAMANPLDIVAITLSCLNDFGTLISQSA